MQVLPNISVPFTYHFIRFFTNIPQMRFSWLQLLQAVASLGKHFILTTFHIKAFNNFELRISLMCKIIMDF